MEKNERLEKLQENYEELKRKYGLPDFESLAEDFDIEKVAEKESKFLLREIRRAVSEKITAYLHLFETFSNPSNAPMYIFSLLKMISDKEEISNIYKRLAYFNLKNFKLDVLYDENKEADFIKEISKEWQDLKKRIGEIAELFEEKFDKDIDIKKQGYFG